MLNHPIITPPAGSDLRVFLAPSSFQPRRVWMPRVEITLFISLGGYFALSLLKLASQV